MTILVVEDDSMLRSLLTMKLRRRGWTVIEASSGTEALDLAQNSPLDMVLTDISLPEMDGKELRRQLGEIHPDLKVIGITADSGAFQELQHLKFFQIWEKPVTDDLLDSITL